MKPCFLVHVTKHGTTRYIPGILVANYDFRDCMRVRIGDHEVITTKDTVVFDIPKTKHQLKREQWEQRKKQKQSEREEFAKLVRSALPGTVLEISKKLNLHPSCIHQRICYWSEFDDVIIENKTYTIKT